MAQETIKVRITGAHPACWYKSDIGKEFEVTDGILYWKLFNDDGFILKTHFQIVSPVSGSENLLKGWGMKEFVSKSEDEEISDYLIENCGMSEGTIGLENALKYIQSIRSSEREKCKAQIPKSLEDCRLNQSEVYSILQNDENGIADKIQDVILSKLSALLSGAKMPSEKEVTDFARNYSLDYQRPSGGCSTFQQKSLYDFQEGAKWMHDQCQLLLLSEREQSKRLTIFFADYYLNGLTNVERSQKTIEKYFEEWLSMYEEQNKEK
jgi:hypothetical protein